LAEIERQAERLILGGLRAPYMRNASIATLSDVVRHYEKGGIERPSRSPMMLAIQLTDEQRLDLVAFMETLTGNDDSARLAR
jgi:cytochrome c peroxidase